MRCAQVLVVLVTLGAFKQATSTPAKWKKGKSWWSSAEEVEPVPKLDLAPLSRYPVWKVHKYKGVELKPVVLVDASSPTAIPPPILPVVYGAPPAEYGPPPALPDVYGPPPAIPDVYGPPPAIPDVYGPPVPPLTAYGLPPPSLPTVYGEPPQNVYLPPVVQPDPRVVSPNSFQYADNLQTLEESAVDAVSDEDVQSGLDTLSNLGALTSFLDGGDSTGHVNVDRLQAIFQIISSDSSLLDRLKSIKNLKHSVGGELLSTAKAAPARAASAVYYPTPAPTRGFLYSLLPSFLRSDPAPPSVPLPPLPEVSLTPAHTVAALESFNLPDLPVIHLPPYTADTAPVPSGPYVKVQYAPLAGYTAPLNHRQPLYDSYGTALPSDAYSAATSGVGVTVAPPQEDIPELTYNYQYEYDDQPEMQPQSAEESNSQ